VRDDAVYAEAALFVLFVIGKIALKPFDMAVALEGQNMGRNAIQKKAVMRDDDGAARQNR
jgi:hypothetical protein